MIVEYQAKYYVFSNWHVIHDADADAIRIKLADGRTIHPTKVLGTPKPTWR